MNIFARIGRSLTDAFQTNLNFLTAGFDGPGSGFLEGELRTLVARDLPILVHKRDKFCSAQAPNDARWSDDLAAFVSRTVRPKLAGNSLLALWNDNALIRMLDSIVVSEQQLVAIRTTDRRQLPVTSRFDSPWAG